LHTEQREVGFEYLKSKNPMLRRLNMEAGTGTRTTNMIGGPRYAAKEKSLSNTITVTANEDGGGGVTVVSSAVERMRRRVELTNYCGPPPTCWIARLEETMRFVEEAPGGTRSSAYDQDGFRIK
jgi:hypothetical protein